jgi:shikimate kinase
MGIEVARKLGWRFIDTDEEIVRISGKSVPEIFTHDGEARFVSLRARCWSGPAREPMGSLLRVVALL